VSVLDGLNELIVHGTSLIAPSVFGQHKKRNRYLPKPSHMDFMKCVRRQKDLSRLLDGLLPSLAYDILISSHPVHHSIFM
jgi:hypothetical protein